MTLERLLVLLEDRIQEHENEENSTYSEGYAEACRWVLEALEEALLRGEVQAPFDDDEENSW
jgi:hypothetical protein